MDQKDVIAFFTEIKNTKTENELTEMFENYDIGKLDISRIYRYIDKYNDTGDDTIDIDVEKEDINEIIPIVE